MLVFAGCSAKKLPSDLYIEAKDVFGAPSGEFYLPFSVNNYKKYELKYNLSVFVAAYNADSNTAVQVKNNRSITVEKDRVYAVVVRVDANIDGEPISLTKQFTVEAEKADRTVTFMHSENEVIKRITVPYGGSVDMSELPELPDRYTVASEGHVTVITGKRWVVYDAEGNPSELIEEYLTDIKENIPVYSEYSYAQKPLDFTVKFDTDGGNEMPDAVYDSDTIVDKQPSPVKDGYTFIGWCSDEERKTLFDWKAKQKLVKDITLYAKWVKNTVNPTSYVHFNFRKAEDNEGNEFYFIEAKDKNNLTGDVVLPNNYNGLPIRRMEEKAFEGTDITSVVIPNCYVLDDRRAFAECKKLTSVRFEDGNESASLAPEIFRQCVLLEEIVLPDSIRRINPNAFSNCLALANVKLPESLVFITGSAFENCKSLTEIVLPDSTERILAYAFKGCENLAVCEISEDSRIIEFGDGVFECTAVRSIKLPAQTEQYKPLENTGIEVTYYPPKPTEPETKPDENGENSTDGKE